MPTRALGLLSLLCWSSAWAATPVATTVLGPFTGHDAKLHPDNVHPEPLRYHGTDLGWSYAHGGKLHFLFGDTHADDKATPIDPRHDDIYGMIDLAEWPDPTKISPSNLPLIKLGEKPGTHQLAGIDPGVPLEVFKTPVAGFSNGTREFGLFFTGKPQICRADVDCSNGLTCNTELGYVGNTPEMEPGLTLTCAKSWPGCTPRKPEQGGFCVDRTSSMWTDTDFGNVSAAGMRHYVAIRDANDPARYTHAKPWLTNKFVNVVTRTVAAFEPTARSQDYRKADGAGGKQRVFLWGRPHFVGVNAKGNTLGMYFAYVDMPAGPDFTWDIHYFAGTDSNGTPRFSRKERDAVAVDLDASQPGVQAQEAHDLVQHMSIVWMEQLQQWVMFYGGGVSKFPYEDFAPRCGVLELFVRTECDAVEMGNGAIRMRTAEHPWGPWSAPQDLIVGGNPDARPLEGQYAEGGVLHHPECKGSRCQSRSEELPLGDYGWFYGANIIEEWTRPAGNGVDVLWIASTWNPYRVILLRTRIDK